MKKILFLILVALSACKKESVEPVIENNFIKIFVDNHVADTSHFSYNLYYTEDSTTFDQSVQPVKIFSGVKSDLWNGLYFDAIKIDMNKAIKIYVVGYATKPPDTLAHRFWFLPSNANKLIELPATIY